MITIYSRYKKQLLIIFGGLFLIGLIFYLGVPNIFKRNTHIYSLDELTTYQGLLGIKKPIDTTIVKTYGSYQYKNTENTFKSYYKENPLNKDAIKFTANHSTISFNTVSKQSFGNLQSDKIKHEGNSIVYQDIFPQIDLKYTVSPDQLLEEFIIYNPLTAEKVTDIKQQANVSNIDSYKSEDGKIIFSRDDKPRFIIPRPVIYELNNKDQRSYGIEYKINELADNSFEISKVITEEGKLWLSSPERNYPIVIDLVIDNADTSSSWVSSDATNLAVSQETTFKQEGSGSLKLQPSAISETNINLMEYNTDESARSALVSNATTSLATGGTTSTSNNYIIHRFTDSGTFSPSANLNLEYFIVGGGGGGGNGSTGSNRATGGGGAGGVLSGTTSVNSGSNTTVTIGAAGTPNNNGGDSVFGSFTAVGGGHGGGVGGTTGGDGGSGGGGYANGASGGTGTTNQGNRGGNGVDATTAGAGGGGGAGAVGSNGTSSTGGNGGAGLLSSITGTNVNYAGGGGGGIYNNGSAGSGGSGGAGDGSKTTTGGSASIANRGSGGGGCAGINCTGGSGSAGVVIVRYSPLQVYSESTIKTQGSYSLKGFAYQSISADVSLIQTIASPLNLTDATNATLDIRASRVGSNIKIGLHDSGGTTTEITPNITQADTFQTISLDLRNIIDSNKDNIDQLIITIVNADADNTFYIDNVKANISPSINDTATLTANAIDISMYNYLTFWVRSTSTGSFLDFQFGESNSNEQSTSFSINSANTWELKTWDISAIPASSRNAVTKFAFKVIDSTNATIYIDDIHVSNLLPPTIQTPEAITDTSIRWNFVDNSSGEIGFRLYDTNNSLTFTCSSANILYCDESGLLPNTQYSRKVAAYDINDQSGYSGITTSKYTLAAIPEAPSVSGRTATTVDIDVNPSTNPNDTLFAVYKEEGSSCDGSGGGYIAANGSDNSSTPVWQTNTTWATTTVTGLSSEKSYVFCAKAKNNENIETSFSAIGAHNTGYIPISGDFVYTTDTTQSSEFTSRYVDGNNHSRYVLGVDNGGSPNSAKFQVKSGILTINSTDTLIVGSLELTGGSIAIADGGSIEVGKPMWIVDADSDGHPSGGYVYYGDAPTNSLRKNQSTSLSAADCDDSFYSLANTCFLAATGGTVTTDGNYKIHKFTSNGTLTITALGKNNDIEYLVVGGGGGGGWSRDGSTTGRGGGGGGAGGMLTGTKTMSSLTSYSITVGGGGSRGASGGVASNGEDSQFDNITANGGGRGGRGSDSSPTVGGNGGSGGGAGANTSSGGGSGTAGQGNDGGVSSNNRGGGGGGAGGAGTAGSIAWNGGSGLASSITGSSVTYAAGGRGGQTSTDPSSGASGAANTGNGGSAGVYSGDVAANGGNGGSGVVIIRYLYK